MLDVKDLNFLENSSTFDFKTYVNKVLSYWKWFFVVICITFFIAYQINIRKQQVYGLETVIAVKDENNPFFTSNTSLVFNWGGTSEKIQSLLTSINSRSHNELVVDNLEFYVQYLEQGEYSLLDVYGEAPFKVKIDKNKGQLANTLIGITVLNEKEFELNIEFSSKNISVYRYSDKKMLNSKVNNLQVAQKYRFNELINTPFFNGIILHEKNYVDYINKPFFIRFDDFDATVSNYLSVTAEVDKTGGSVINVGLQGVNKNRIVDYLNNTVKYLISTQLSQKNQFAVNTIRFIDSTLVAMEKELSFAEDELNDFRKGKNMLELESGGQMLVDKISKYDSERDFINRKIVYYNSLQSYLVNSKDFSKLPAPTVAGIDDPNIVLNVTKLISLSAERSKMQFAVKNEYVFREFDSQMEAVKRVLLENISSVRPTLLYDLELISRKIVEEEKNIIRLPEEQQQLIKIRRKYDINDETYLLFLQKRSEANIVKAANLSDIHVIDEAKDIGGGLLGSNTEINYVFAFFTGLFIVLIGASIQIVLDNKINKSEDLLRLTKIPIIGVIGKKKNKGNLSVFENQKSALAEAFRSVRSSLQFIYNNHKIKGSKVLMITSTVSGEGKTFCSVNLATIFALSEKKTVLVGLDLRKPKIFDDFEINNNIGVVNYLIDDVSLETITQKTRIPYLDVITAGPIPPNPAELMLSDRLVDLITLLREKYDYVILDTAPIGLVSDAMELAPLSDACLYVVRQGTTENGMLRMVNEKFAKKELTNLSIIGNGFEASRRYGYGYSSGYGYGYGYGYGDKSGYYLKDKKNSILDFFKKIVDFKKNR